MSTAAAQQHPFGGAPRRGGVQPAGPPLRDDRRRRPASAGAGLRRARAAGLRSLERRAAQPAVAAGLRSPGGDRLRQHPARRPGHRALGRGELRAQPDLLRPGQPRAPRGRGRLQRLRLDARRARRRQPPLGPSPAADRQAQPQRAADGAQRPTTRSCSRRCGARTSSARRASARRSTSARRRPTARSSRSPRRSRTRTAAACSRSCGATCAARSSSSTASTTTSPPTSPPRPTTSA